MNEVFRFIALAAALGLAAGMVLGAVALLLAAPAQAQERLSREQPAQVECMPVLRLPAPPRRLEI